MVDERDPFNSFNDDPGYKLGSHGNMSEPDAGKMSLTIEEIPSKYGDAANVTIITVTMTIFDTDEKARFTFDLDGFHFKRTGNILMSTSSLKYSGLQYLPHLILDETYFEEARDLMYRYLNITITSYEEDLDFAIFQGADISSDNCEYVVYGHFDSVPFSPEQLKEIEEETRHPTGKPIPRLPQLKMSPLLYSPDCAVALKSTDVDGEKLEQYWYRIRVVVLVGVVLLLSQVILFARQMRDTSTPSLMLKVNFVTIIMMAVMDGSIWMASFVSFFVDSLALPFMSMAFLSFVLTSLYELRYMVDIYQVQRVEASAQVRVQSNGDKPLLNATLRPKVDCAICMMPIELVLFNKLDASDHADTAAAVAAANSVMNAPSALLARRKYMVTPCQHVFHTECLEMWMRSRLQCPICRNPLPPL
ncbi:hypothetical protein DV451_000523 [Geotrichum candidum]|uniref:RING-type E3 ubiquitin transferase n=1 Tax=Geotrichum candidum TaxID=1173061 RepID=A0A9P5GAY2_GEOCN|nr:hypothetical protein DV451_000523 [Geotrichum candidum]KAF5111415.1 hypothetical protein DV453_000060 [Geotrichum candidum]KAF5115533.1 hypothetical protein DV454_002253 [Geotrichum candidum]KAF5116050.1 hypothetical protein DV452_002790 [Geotrichum candidum]KAI9214111.1 hypothetical protein DS838_001043 [Geotrichum bryndzae]